MAIVLGLDAILMRGPEGVACFGRDFERGVA